MKGWRKWSDRRQSWVAIFEFKASLPWSFCSFFCLGLFFSFFLCFFLSSRPLYIFYLKSFWSLVKGGFLDLKSFGLKSGIPSPQKMGPSHALLSEKSLDSAPPCHAFATGADLEEERVGDAQLRVFVGDWRLVGIKEIWASYHSFFLSVSISNVFLFQGTPQKTYICMRGGFA